jgi:DNA invertase Pin-like site-specific DNA recombinase
MSRFVAYARVSTDKQGRSGLGLDAQQSTIMAHIGPQDALLAPIMVEIESGKRNDRPVLAAALERCKLTGATLLVAKLDRLSRDAAFVQTILGSGVPCEFCDVPQSRGATGAFILSVMASVAQLEAGLISERTKAALAAAKARGTVLGGFRGHVVDHRLGGAATAAAATAFAARVAPIARQLRDSGKSLRAIAAELDAQHVATARGGRWTAEAVRTVLAR